MPKKPVSYLLALLLLFANIKAGDAPASFSADSIGAAHLKLKSAEWQSLHDKQITTRAVSGSHGKEMAGFGAMVAEASPREFITAFETLAVFAGSETTLACGRFGKQPSLADLDNPLFTSKLKARLAAEYKQVLLDKARAYLEGGEAALCAYVDQETEVSPQEVFAGMSAAQAKWSGHTPQLYARLSAHPRQTESFLYWALQKFGKLKPVISLIHVLVHHEGPRVFIASKQVYSSHYTEAGLGVAELIPFSDAGGRARTLTAYTIRLQVDLLGGSMGFMKKRMAQPHLLETIKTSLNGLRLSVEALSN